ncbi:universal stress protein [Salinarchaeum chitinilyticum]
MAPEDDPLSVETVLVPVDGTEEATEAAEYAIAVADRYDADVAAVYVLAEAVTRAIERDAVDHDAVAEETQSYVDGLAETASAAGVQLDATVAYGFSQTRKSQHPGSVILDTADEIGADFLVIPREPQREDERDTLAKAAEYVLLYASQPVLSV